MVLTVLERWNLVNQQVTAFKYSSSLVRPLAAIPFDQLMLYYELLFQILVYDRWSDRWSCDDIAVGPRVDYPVRVRLRILDDNERRIIVRLRYSFYHFIPTGPKMTIADLIYHFR